MSKKNRLKVAILHNQVSSESTQDELDVITQVNAVSQALAALGYEPVALSLSLNMHPVIEALKSFKPVFVFNLVESIEGTGRFIYFAAALLDQMHLPYSGSGTDPLYLTTNKLLSKEWMRFNRIATPPWAPIDDLIPVAPDFKPPYIVKPVWEDASVGLDESSVFYQHDDFRQTFKDKLQASRDLFAETYIPGREFNISILADEKTPQILPIAEIEFVDYPVDKARIVDYRAKWEPGSFEYQHTVRRFDLPSEDAQLRSELCAITHRCWQIFNLRGYARVDFRVDENGKPWVLEINANPCISPDSGFVAAAEQAGLNFKSVIERIIDDIPIKIRTGRR